jgi:hypothetical protein
MGLSFLLDDTTRELHVTVSWGDYQRRASDTNANINPDISPDT